MNASLQLKTQELIAAYLAESRKFDAEARRLEKLARNMKLMIEQGGIASDATAEVSEPLHQAQGVSEGLRILGGQHLVFRHACRPAQTGLRRCELNSNVRRIPRAIAVPAHFPHAPDVP